MPLLAVAAGKAMPDMAIGYITRKDKAKYIDVQNLASRIRARTLMAIPLMDEVCPPSTQFAAYNRISAPKRLCIYPDWGHEYIPRHADIVFGFLNDWP